VKRERERERYGTRRWGRSSSQVMVRVLPCGGVGGGSPGEEREREREREVWDAANRWMELGRPGEEREVVKKEESS
jgi:hypothetical protein